MNDKITVLLADDHQLLTEGLQRIINENAHLQVIGSAATICQVLDMLNDKVDVLLLDVFMPDGNSIDMIPEIHRRFQNVRVLMLSCYCEAAVVRRALDMGATGFMSKASSSADILEGIIGAAHGKQIIGNDLRALLKRAPKEIIPLTRREREILRLVVSEGLSYKEIAARLGLTFNTVHDHLRNMRAKLNAKSMADLVCRAKDQCL